MRLINKLFRFYNSQYHRYNLPSFFIFYTSYLIIFTISLGFSFVPCAIAKSSEKSSTTKGEIKKDAPKPSPLPKTTPKPESSSTEEEDSEGTYPAFEWYSYAGLRFNFARNKMGSTSPPNFNQHLTGGSLLAGFIGIAKINKFFGFKLA